MTLAELRDKANTKLTPVWDAVEKFETRYFTKNGAYKAVPIRKLNIEQSERFDVWARVVADATGFSLQVLVELDGTQYARAKGYGTGQTFAWKTVSVGTLATSDDGPPNSFYIERYENGGKLIAF